VEDFEKIYITYHDQIYKYVLKLCQNEDLAEEITQETFFKVLKKINTYRGECKLSVWMCQIAKNTFYNYLKRKNRQADYPMESLQDEKNFESVLADKDMALQIHKILHDLEEPHREVFWMRTFGELSFAEIAKVFDKTESWARVTYHRAKMRIKEELE